VAGCSSKTSDDAVDRSESELQSSAPDPTGQGSLATTTTEYRFDASVDPDVMPDRATEVWAQMWRPVDLGDTPRPLLVFLHGNHGTCGRGSPRIDDNAAYTNTGTCTPPYVVTPNHMGYAYLAERLASWGYIVVSINANRGITAGRGVSGDAGLILARGNLVLKHLQKLADWNAAAEATPASLGVDLKGRIDFDHVGLMGHSRGGEGVRAAYNLYKDPGSPWPARIKVPLNVRSILEYAPVDGQSDRVLDALGTAWNVVLPMCDGDVFDLQGMLPFDRMTLKDSEPSATPKSIFAVFGANHNFFNTEWQQSDARGCRGVGNTAIFSPAASASEIQQKNRACRSACDVSCPCGPRCQRKARRTARFAVRLAFENCRTLDVRTRFRRWRGT